MNKPKLLGLAEIADLYGISKTSANAWTRRHDFPNPITKLAMGPVWDQDEVIAWRSPIATFDQKLTIRCAWCGCGEMQDCNPHDGGFVSTCGECGMTTVIEVLIAGGRIVTIETSKPKEA